MWDTLDIMHHEDGPGLGRERGDRPLEVHPERDIGGLAAGIRQVAGQVRFACHARATPARTARVHQHDIHREPVEPGPEAAIAPKTPELLPQADKDVLQQFSREGAITGHPHAEGKHPGCMGVVQRGKGVGVAGARSKNRRIDVHWG